MLGCIRYTHQKGNVTLSSSFTDVFGDEIPDSQPISLPSSADTEEQPRQDLDEKASYIHPTKGTGQIGSFRSAHEIVAPVKALCTERITEWHSKFNKLGLLCIEVTGDTDVDFDQLQPYKRWRDHRGLVEMVKLFLIDEVHILNDKIRGPVLESVVSRMKAIEIFCNTRKSVLLTAETLSREITITFNPEQKAKLTALASTIKNKKLQALVLAGVGCHHAGMLYEERFNIEHAFRNRDLPILITTTTLAMGVNLPAHLVIVKNTQQYVNGAYQEYSISTVLQMLGRAGRPQFDTEATAVIMTRQRDKA
ncbi:unnamed protein product [Diatraea saccharalis]|uniref:Helicase C-terminal domain-containing protein n=1 Tax=Diatraea saccharalis TaxID=40085 RepID=A0A9N9QZR7_9NEOP|nr:unnamed protein product [Diatraea saccharalis]